MIIIPKRRNKKADKITNKHLTDMVDELLGGNHLVECTLAYAFSVSSGFAGLDSINTEYLIVFIVFNDLRV